MSVVGTTEFMAPEVVAGTGHTTDAVRQRAALPDIARLD